MPQHIADNSLSLVSSSHCKMKLYSDYPHSDGFFADSFGGVTSESLLAEREGFKPPKRTSRFPDFESGPFGHSGISPKGKTPLLNYRVQR